MRTIAGGCHCGAVRWEARTPDPLEVWSCNCSICDRLGYLHIIVPQPDVKLLAGEDHIVTYTFNTGVAQHTFCGVCGIKSFYTPRSNPDCYSLNARCLDGIHPEDLEIKPFDGRNWEEHVEQLRRDHGAT
ncbi:MAG: GFA family protein [Verrucomicrobiota bacterium]